MSRVTLSGWIAVKASWPGLFPKSTRVLPATFTLRGRRPERATPALAPVPYLGRTLWLCANRLFGSYRRLTAARRSYVSAG
jgi:hypothetical protein